ncbi:MAG: CbtB domain-containing protein [bacterium]
MDRSCSSFVVGFAQGSGGILHNAAHDTRHAATFPCH